MLRTMLKSCQLPYHYQCVQDLTAYTSFLPELMWLGALGERKGCDAACSSIKGGHPRQVCVGRYEQWI